MKEINDTIDPLDNVAVPKEMGLTEPGTVGS